METATPVSADCARLGGSSIISRGELGSRLVASHATKLDPLDRPTLGGLWIRAVESSRRTWLL